MTNRYIRKVEYDIDNLNEAFRTLPDQPLYPHDQHDMNVPDEERRDLWDFVEGEVRWEKSIPAYNDGGGEVLDASLIVLRALEDMFATMASLKRPKIELIDLEDYRPSQHASTAELDQAIQDLQGMMCELKAKQLRPSRSMRRLTRSSSGARMPSCRDSPGCRHCRVRGGVQPARDPRREARIRLRRGARRGRQRLRDTLAEIPQERMAAVLDPLTEDSRSWFNLMQRGGRSSAAAYQDGDAALVPRVLPAPSRGGSGSGGGGASCPPPPVAATATWCSTMGSWSRWRATRAPGPPARNASAAGSGRQQPAGLRLPGPGRLAGKQEQPADARHQRPCASHRTRGCGPTRLVEEEQAGRKREMQAGYKPDKGDRTSRRPSKPTECTSTTSSTS